MNSLFQVQESSFGTGKRIAVVVAGMLLVVLALLAGVVMALLIGAGSR